MSAVLRKVIIAGQRMELWECRGPRYWSVFRLLSDPDKVSITHLGSCPYHAADQFTRKVDCHRILATP